MINDIKDLEKLLKLCRKQGVLEINLGTVSFRLGDLPSEPGKLMQEEIPSDNPYANFPEGDLTPSQLMFYSAGGLPDDDPEFKEAP